MGQYQLTFKNLWSVKVHLAYFFPLLPWGTSCTLCSLSPPWARRDLACPVLLTAQLLSTSFRFSGPLLDPTWLSPWCPKLCPTLFLPLPFPPYFHNFSWEVLVSLVFETDAPTPPGGQGFTITCSHTCLACRFCEKLAVNFLKIKTFISCHPNQGNTNISLLPRIDPGKIKYSLNIFAST